MILYLWAASQVYRFFVEARRSGLLESMLATPLNERQIVPRQWQALLWVSGLLVALLLSVHVATATLSQAAFQGIATQASTVTSPAVTNQSRTYTSQTFPVRSMVIVPTKARTNAASAPRSFRVGTTPQQMVLAAVAAAAAGLTTSTNLIAICRFGMYMGMTYRSANLATFKPNLFVQVIPRFVIAFATSVVAGLVMSGLAFRGG